MGEVRLVMATLQWCELKGCTSHGPVPALEHIAGTAASKIQDVIPAIPALNVVMVAHRHSLIIKC